MGYRDLQYEQSNIGYNKQYLDGGIKCKNYELCKQKSLTESEDLREQFSWEKIGEIGYKTIMEF